MKRLLRFVVLGLVLLTVAMVSALTAMRFAIHGREVVVPRLVGLGPQQAATAASSLGLIVVQENKFYSAEIVEGRIVSQMPPEGTHVRRGWRLRVATSLGPLRTEVPNLIGQSSRAAEINISRRGLELATVAQAKVPGATAGQVIAQSPPPNATSMAAPRISVLMAAPDTGREYVMPNFIGKNLADVKSQIEEAGFQLGTVTEVAWGNPPVTTNTAHVTLAPAAPTAGIVVRQSPAAGQKITEGDNITLDVSK